MIPKFATIMMTHNRHDLLERTIESFNNSTELPSKLYIFDDYSKDIATITRIVLQAKIPIVLYTNAKSINCSRRTRFSLAYIFEKHPNIEGIINLNSDMIFNKNWYTVLLNRYKAIKERDKFLGAISVYNYKGHKSIQSINLNESGTIRLLRKASIGIFGCLVTRHFWRDCIKTISHDSGWEYNMSKLARSHNWNMYCTMPSYVQHTGTKDGVHAHKGVWARDFIGE